MLTAKSLGFKIDTYHANARETEIGMEHTKDQVKRTVIDDPSLLLLAWKLYWFELFTTA